MLRMRHPRRLERPIWMVQRRAGRPCRVALNQAVVVLWAFARPVKKDYLDFLMDDHWISVRMVGILNKQNQQTQGPREQEGHARLSSFLNCFCARCQAWLGFSFYFIVVYSTSLMPYAELISFQGRWRHSFCWKD